VIKPIICVRMDSAVVDALDILFRNKVSGIALVDDGGRVTGNLSASDLRVGSTMYLLAAPSHSFTASTGP